MAASSLNQGIFRLVVGIVVLTVLGVLVSIWTSTIRHGQQQLNKELVVAENVVQQVLGTREEQLITSAYVVTADFGFKQAVASEDVGTINSALLNQRQRINADLMAVVSLDGRNIASEPGKLSPSDSFPYPGVVERVIAEGGASALLMLGDTLYQMIALTVDAPQPIAIALVGFRVDNALLSQLKQITQLEISVTVEKDNNQLLRVSTFPSADVDTVLATDEISWLDVLFADSLPLVSRQFVLADNSSFEVTMEMSQDLEQMFSEFSNLQSTISAISAIAIVMALLLAAWFARRVAKPLETLAGYAKRIARGEYQQTIETETKTREFNVLADAFSSMQKNIQSREAEITFQAQHDVLTQLFNRYYVGNVLDEKLEQGEAFQAIGINIFGFRGINDIFGYHNGDQCLKALSERVMSLGGISARLTGGELLWVPPEPVSAEELQTVKDELEQPLVMQDVTINLKVAMGVLMCPEDASTAEIMFKRLNIVLDEAQITRKLLLHFDTELEQRYSRRLLIVTELKKALSDNQHELNVVYQPKLDLQTFNVDSVEALIRWNSEKLGFVPPDEFISIAEQAGIIDGITKWVISRVMDDLTRFHSAGVKVTAAINLSAQDMLNTSLLPFIDNGLGARNLSHDALSFEITESDLLKHPDKAIAQMHRFREKGFELAIDDFGTGYSSMAYLKNLPVDTLKVDKAFVLNLDSEEKDQHIVRTVINLAHSFDMSVVAEGIENIASLTLLKEYGCQRGQGYHICKPAQAEDFIAWYKENEHKDWMQA